MFDALFFSPCKSLGVRRALRELVQNYFWRPQELLQLAILLSHLTQAIDFTQ